jgi:2,5-dihydroxypyridine 5,6-dioxygenase
MSELKIDPLKLANAANFLIADALSVKPGEQVVLTADTATDRGALDALMRAVSVQGALCTVVTIPQLPYQGALSDPYIPPALAVAVRECDVWLDLTFPYMAGAEAHDHAIKGRRVRFVNVADLGSIGLARIWGGTDFDKLFAVQSALDDLFVASTGKTARVTTSRGTDVTFTLAKPTTRKLRHTNVPGSYSPPGSAVIYPEPDSVKGVVFIEAVFHEYYMLLPKNIGIHVDGPIQRLEGEGVDVRLFERALLRASGGDYGKIIHFSHGFHPAARVSGRSFVESIRSSGSDAVGFGKPWWEEGGGENHPDGVITSHSLWIDGEPIVKDGVIVKEEIAPLEKALYGG